jgi:hypothetical protein
METEGYFFIGLGEKYIDECYNLSLTIRKQKDDRPISLLVHEKDIEYAKNKNIFDKLVIFNPDQNCEIWKICNNYFEKYCLYPRLHLNDYTPYDITITVDSDELCQHSPENIWTNLKTKNFPVQMVGRKFDLRWHWGTISDVIKAYGKHVPHVHGGFFYIKKNNELTNKFFDYAKSLVFQYDNLNCKRWYADGLVDEILFAITHAYFNLEPINFDEFPIITFNYYPGIEIPSTYQTADNQNIFMDSPIPFVHMFDKLHGNNYNWLLKEILNKH